MVSPSRSHLSKFSCVAHFGTRLLFARSTRGASVWVVKMATGLPDCTSSVSSRCKLRSAARIASKASQLPSPTRRQMALYALPVACRPPPPAVDNEVVRVKGHLRIEVVLQHTVGRFDLPVFARQLRAAWGLDGSGHAGPPSGEARAGLEYGPCA